jgi:hypothetical protein
MLAQLAVAAGMFQLTTPAVAPRTAPPTTFSAARAMPVGSKNRLLTSVELPGVSYLFTWPLLAALLAALWRMHISEPQRTPWSNAASLALAAIPGIVLFTPAIELLFAMLGLSLGRLPVAGVSLLLAPLLGGLLIPHLAALSPRVRVRTSAPVASECGSHPRRQSPVGVCARLAEAHVAHVPPECRYWQG